MTRYFVLLALPLLWISFSRPDSQAEDRAAVERAVQDYVEALYEAKPELIERSVHPDLAKRGSWRAKDSDEYRDVGLMSYDQLHELSGEWNAEGKRKGLESSIDIYDVTDISAAAKLSAYWGIDYMHLSKIDDKWMIMQILWQSHPPEK